MNHEGALGRCQPEEVPFRSTDQDVVDFVVVHVTRRRQPLPVDRAVVPRPREQRQVRALDPVGAALKAVALGFRQVEHRRR